MVCVNCVHTIFIPEHTTQNAKRRLNEHTRTTDHAREQVMNLFITGTKTPGPSTCPLYTWTGRSHCQPATCA